MTKILKPYTIIPPDLYVLRDADKQVSAIISDMGRPGYVLVSRQMGKTNLLLNAKRSHETEKDIFVYVDLSNSFPSAKSCFENIINVALESYPDKFEKVEKGIFEKREELKETPPHKQHTSELRVLLKALNGGKMVIILDEIDALTKTDYSDQIFSQIRSSYFASRVNFKEFYNLTYLLSGVVEPNEIIKDPKISPFNIGQKIYLNDFSRKEYESFIDSSKLNLSTEIRDRIFFWTNGNPRMTWDVCAEVESKLEAGSLNRESIDKIINDLYLTTFDKPPIDNIRELAKKDKEIRNSIIEIEYKKGKEVSDKVKSKLYLSGIINYEEDDVHLKNEIIKQSLSLKWIRSLEEEEKGLINVAMDEYRNLNYQDTLFTLEKFLVDNEFPEDSNRPHYYYIMGHCAYKLLDFEKSLDYFNKANFDIEDEAAWYYKVLNQKGLVYYYQDKIEESLSHFKMIIDSGKKDDLYAKALLNYGSISLSSQGTIHKEAAYKIFEDLINETAFKKDKLSPDSINELKSIAYYNLGQLADKEDNQSAVENYRKAIPLAKENTKPTIIMALLNVTTNIEEKSKLLNDLIELISTEKIKPIEADPEKPIDFSFDEFRDIAIMAYLNFHDSLFAKIIPKLSLLGEFPLATHVYQLAAHAIRKNKDWEVGVKVLEKLYDKFNDSEYGLNPETRYNTIKLLAYFTRQQEARERALEFINLFETERLAPVDYVDMEIFANLIYALSEGKKYQDALKYVRLINSVRQTESEANLLNYLVIDHLELNLLSYINDWPNARKKAQEIVVLANNEKVKQQNSNLLGETGLEIIRQNAQNVITPVSKSKTPIKSAKSYHRNDIVKVRYKDGTTIETKFKKVEKDLTKGDCYILSI